MPELENTDQKPAEDQNPVADDSQKQDDTQKADDPQHLDDTQDPDREPGGDEPQAVRARKEYRLRKRLEAQLEDERRSNIAREARLKALEEFKPRESKETKKVYTAAELQVAVDAGTITVMDAANYLAEQRAKETADRVRKEEREIAAREYQESQVKAVLAEYTTAAPWLKDKYDSRRKPVEEEFYRLVDPNGNYRLPDTLATELLALERVLGTPKAFKDRTALESKGRQARSDMHVESGAGGGTSGAPKGTGQKPDLAKMPQHFKDYWEKSQTPQADREKEAALYWKRAGAKK